jgi:citrate synthase
MPDARGPLRTSLGRAEADRVLVRGHDLTEELLGRVTYADMVVLLLLGRMPSEADRRMVDALLVSLIEHGLVKPVVTARFVYSNAPESLQAAVAASLLGAGSRHLGSSEWCARMLQEAVAMAGDDADGAAEEIVGEHRAAGTRVPGIGHRTHAEGDPRADRLLGIARETGHHGPHCRLLERVADLASTGAGRPLPVNVTGAIAAIASDIGFRWEIVRGFALISRTLGALAHIQEEMDEPLSDRLIRQIQQSVEYEAEGP